MTRKVSIVAALAVLGACGGGGEGSEGGAVVTDTATIVIQGIEPSLADTGSAAGPAPVGETRADTATGP